MESSRTVLKGSTAGPDESQRPRAGAVVSVRDVLHSLGCLNIWSPVGGAVWELEVVQLGCRGYISRGRL